MNRVINCNLKQRMVNYVRDNLIVVVMVILVVATVIVEPKYLSTQNIANIFSQFGPLSLVSLGMTCVILGGYIDLSVAGVINLVAVTTILLIGPLGQVPALVIGVLMGLIMGLITGAVIISSGAATQSDSMFLTFGMSTVYSALARIVSGGVTQQLSWIETDYSLFTCIGSGRIGIIPVSIIIFLICLLALTFFSKTYMGRSVYLTGGNKNAARLVGIPVKKTIMLMYIISGLMAAIGSIVLFTRVTIASPTLGVNFETNAILAVVLGGTALKGGKGSFLRTVLGVALVTMLSNCMNLMGVSTFMQTIMNGLVLVLAIWLDNRKDMKGVQS